MWAVVGTVEFEDWFVNLEEVDRARIEDRVDLLEEVGPALGRPVVDSLKSSRHRNMKELRAGSLRVLFIFDPLSTAVLLLGGDKRDRWTDWYVTAIIAADDLYDQYLNDSGQSAKAT